MIHLLCEPPGDHQFVIDLAGHFFAFDPNGEWTTFNLFRAESFSDGSCDTRRPVSPSKRGNCRLFPNFWDGITCSRTKRRLYPHHHFQGWMRRSQEGKRSFPRRDLCVSSLEFFEPQHIWSGEDRRRGFQLDHNSVRA